MSVMSLGRRPGSVIRPLRAGSPASRASRSRAPAGRGAQPGPDVQRGRGVPPGRDARPGRGGGAQREQTLRLVQPGEIVPAREIATSGPAGPGLGAPGAAAPGPAGRRPAAAGAGEPVRPGQVQRSRPAAGPPRAGQARSGQAQSAQAQSGQAQSGQVKGGRPTRRTRLTRRGRRVVWVLAALLVAAVLTPVVLLAAGGAQAANHGVPASVVRSSLGHVVVRPGQSLWSIAVQTDPQADPRTVVQQIIQLNALGSDVVVPGESLWVPKG